VSNIILTRRCGKNCSFCFAKTESKEEMSVENFTKIIDSFPDNYVKLMGGEPTEHSEFAKILKICMQRNSNIIVLSNFLFSDSVRNSILEIIRNNPKIKLRFFLNSTELDVGNRMEKFKKNYNEIYSLMHGRREEEGIGCGIVIDKNKSTEYYINYIDFLLKNLTRIERMRLSLNFPSGDDKNNFYFINNHKLGATFASIVRKLLIEGIEPTLDCIHFPCMYSTREEWKLMKKFATHVDKKSCEDMGGAIDYLPDGKAIYCFPNSSISVETNQFKSDAEIADALRLKYRTIKSSVKYPYTCDRCAFRGLTCDGPCLAFFKL
jgi:organic radical activating enzyme